MHARTGTFMCDLGGGGGMVKIVQYILYGTVGTINVTHTSRLCGCSGGADTKSARVIYGNIR